jgi:putative transposase
MPAPRALLQRDFTADAPNKVWVADTTYLHCTLGFVYLVVIIDLYSRRFVGWAVGAHHDAALTPSALGRAIVRRGPPPGLIFHTDHGS